MKWISERDALIAQTLAFVQSVTGRKDDVLQPEGTAVATSVVATEFVSVQETVTVQAVAPTAEPPPMMVSSPAPQPEALPRSVQMPPSRLNGDFRSEMQGRIANFRKHQERFEREREEYCAATLTRLRAAIRDPSLRPPSED